MSDINKSMQSSRHLPHGSPESEFSNFECFQNYTAPEVFVQHIAGIVNQGDVQTIVRAQKQMYGNSMRLLISWLQRFEKTNEMLLNCNALSSGRLKAANDDFRKHTRLVTDMKKDLDYIFRKIRSIKARIGAQYPQASLKAEQKIKANSLSEEVLEFSGECSVATEAQASTASAPANRHPKGPVRSARDNVTVDYIQMDRKVEVECGVAANDTDNESSDTSDM